MCVLHTLTVMMREVHMHASWFCVSMHEFMCVCTFGNDNAHACLPFMSLPLLAMFLLVKTPPGRTGARALPCTDGCEAQAGCKAAAGGGSAFCAAAAAVGASATRADFLTTEETNPPMLLRFRCLHVTSFRTCAVRCLHMTSFRTCAVA